MWLNFSFALVFTAEAESWTCTQAFMPQDKHIVIKASRKVWQDKTV